MASSAPSPQSSISAARVGPALDMERPRLSHRPSVKKSAEKPLGRVDWYVRHVPCSKAEHTIGAVAAKMTGDAPLAHAIPGGCPALMYSSLLDTGSKRPQIIVTNRSTPKGPTPSHN